MKLNVKKYIFLFIIGLSTYNAAAQANKFSINLLCKPKNDTLHLRWIPETIETWEAGKKLGYSLFRRTYMRNGKKITTSQTKTLILERKPQPKSYWEKRRDTYGQTVAQILFNPLSVLKEQEENRQKYVFFLSMLSSNMSSSVAEGLALSYKDSTVRKNEKYEYTLVIGNATNPVAQATIFASLDMNYASPSPKILAHSFIDSTATFNFDAKDFTAFRLYRSDDNGVSFHRTNDAPLIPTFSDENNDTYSIADTVKTLYKNYFYRLVGIDPFADESSASQTIKIYAYYTQLPTPQNPSFLPTKDGKLVFFWSYPDTLFYNLKGFRVVKVPNLEDTNGTGLHQGLLPNNTRRFVENKPETEGIYRILAIDLSDREIASQPIIVQLNDTVPPLKPQNLNGKVSPKGIAKIWWSPNTEKDLFGYQIYRANSDKEGFSLVNQTIIKDTIYSDTVSLSMLNKYIYYRVVAVDNHLNPADPVDTLRLKRPDVISPIAPVIEKFTISDTLVSFQWVNSPSEDVALSRLTRETPPDTIRTILIEWKPSTMLTSWNDTTIKEGTSYCYFIEAIDDSENSSGKSCNLPLKTPIPYIRPAIKNLRGVFNKNDGIILLNWPHSFKRRVSYFTLFKRVGFNDLKPFKRLNADITQFKDVDWDISTNYGYVIVANFDDETVSQMSDEIVVRTPDRKR